MKSAAGGRASERWRGEGRATIARSIARSIARVAGRDKQTCASIHSIAARADAAARARARDRRRVEPRGGCGDALYARAGT